MNREEVKEYLSKNLSITIDEEYETGGAKYIVVTLYLEDEEIDNDNYEVGTF